MALYEITADNTHRPEQGHFPDGQVLRSHVNRNTAVPQDSSAISPQMVDGGPSGKYAAPTTSAASRERVIDIE